MEAWEHREAILYLHRFHLEPLRAWLVDRIANPAPVECPALHLGGDKMTGRPIARVGTCDVEFNRDSFRFLVSLAGRRVLQRPGVPRAEIGNAFASDIRVALRNAGLPNEFNLPTRAKGPYVLGIPPDRIVLDVVALRSILDLPPNVLADLPKA